MRTAHRSAARAAGLALLLAGPAAPAAADDFATWYAGGALVFANLQFDDGLIDDDAAGGKLVLGYRFNRWLGVEGSWLQTADFEDDQLPAEPGGDATVALNGLTLSAVVHAPLDSEDVGLYGKAGFYTLDQELDVTDADGATVTSASRSIDGMTLGAGLRVKIAERVDLRAEGDWYSLDGADLWALSLGVDYRFGGKR